MTDGLKCADRLAELFAGAHVSDGVLQRAARRTQRHRRDDEPFDIEPAHQPVPGIADPADHVVGGNDDVGEEDVVDGVAIHGLDRFDVQARPSR